MPVCKDSKPDDCSMIEGNTRGMLSFAALLLKCLELYGCVHNVES